LAKYKLNLDEDAVRKFYERLEMQNIHESHLDDRDASEPFISDIFEESASSFKEMIEMIDEGVYEAFMKHEIVMPYALRGLIILMMGDYSNDDPSGDTFTKLI
jgi:hypothetical protein